MTLLEALLNSRKYYKTDKNYVFTLDKPSAMKSAALGGMAGGAKGLLTAVGAEHASKWGGGKLGNAAKATTSVRKAKILGGASKAALKVGEFATTKAGKYVMRGAGVAAGIPLGAIIGHAIAKRKLKHADPYVKGILEKVKGQEIKGKEYRSLLKGQRAINVSAHRLFPMSRSK
jgi:hypothetical protein